MGLHPLSYFWLSYLILFVFWKGKTQKKTVVYSSFHSGSMGHNLSVSTPRKGLGASSPERLDYDEGGGVCIVKPIHHGRNRRGGKFLSMGNVTRTILLRKSNESTIECRPGCCSRPKRRAAGRNLGKAVASHRILSERKRKGESKEKRLLISLALNVTHIRNSYGCIWANGNVCALLYNMLHNEGIYLVPNFQGSPLSFSLSLSSLFLSRPVKSPVKKSLRNWVALYIQRAVASLTTFFFFLLLV
jgi:hypothetical protein